MYTNLIKKLNSLLSLIKAENKKGFNIDIAPTPGVIDPEKDNRIIALRAAWSQAHAQGKHDLKQEVDKHINLRLSEIAEQNKKLNEAMGKPEQTIQRSKIKSPFTMEDAHSVLLMPHEDARKFAESKVHKHVGISSAHKGEILYKILRAKNPTELSRFIAYHVSNPRRTMGKD